MYKVVFLKGRIIYIGEGNAEFVFQNTPGSTLCQVNDLKELAQLFESHVTLNAKSASPDPNPLDELLKRLDEMKVGETLETVGKKLMQDTDTAMSEIRSLGIKGMKAVGEGFIALGDLVKKVSEDES